MKILLEGGNMFPDVTAFDHKDIPEILKTINKTLEGTGLKTIIVGSGATPSAGKRSGDADFFIDEQDVIDYFKAKDAKTARKSLSDYISKRGLSTAQSGKAVYVRIPLGNEFVQVDLNVVEDAEKMSKFHIHAIPDNSPYKGVNKQLMIAIYAKEKGYMWSAWQRGLFTRNAEGKKGDFVSNDIDEVAKILFGPKADSHTLGSVESMLKALPQNKANELLQKAKADPNWKEIVATESFQLGTNQWFRFMMDRLSR